MHRSRISSQFHSYFYLILFHCSLFFLLARSFFVVAVVLGLPVLPGSAAVSVPAVVLKLSAVSDLAGLLPAEKLLLSFRIWYRILHLPVIHFHIFVQNIFFLFSAILCFFCFKFSNYFYYRFYCTKMRDTNSVSRIIFFIF